MCQFILSLQTRLDLNFHGILQQGRVSPNMLPTSSFQMEILSTISERKLAMQMKHLKKKPQTQKLSLNNTLDVCQTLR